MRIVTHEKLPECCVGCNNQESAENKWGDHVGWYCRKGLFMPTKKNQCKRKIK